MNRMLKPIATVGLLGIGFVAGCGKSDAPPPTATASGQVTFKGKPVPDAKIFFVAAEKGFSANAPIEADGSYKITSGLPAATYKVYFGGTEIVKPPKPGEPPPKMTPLPLPNKYLRETTSGQLADVKAGDNKFDFKLQ